MAPMAIPIINTNRDSSLANFAMVEGLLGEAMVGIEVLRF